MHFKDLNPITQTGANVVYLLINITKIKYT